MEILFSIVLDSVFGSDHVAVEAFVQPGRVHLRGEEICAIPAVSELGCVVVIN